MTSTYSLSHLTDTHLLAELATLLATEQKLEAAVLAHLAEVDARKLYLPAACSSMYAYCVQVLHLAEDAACNRITAARASRRFPAILDAVAENRLHLTAVVLLAPHLTEENADELIVAASRRSKSAIQALLAARFARPDLATRLEPMPTQAVATAAVPGRITPAPVHATKTTPLAPQRFGLQLTIDQATQEKLLRAQALLRHRLPSGDLAQVVDRALDALLADLERTTRAATDRPRASKSRSTSRRTGRTRTPNHVRRAVFARDGEQCTFVSADGVRCTERGFLQLDHILEVARGGEPTVENLRVRCRAHNQFAAERTFGRAFMDARRAPAPKPAPRDVVDAGDRAIRSGADNFEADTVLALRGLGVKAADARHAIDASAHVPAATLEARIRAALAVLHTTYSCRCSESPTTSWGFVRDATLLHVASSTPWPDPRSWDLRCDESPRGGD